MKKINIVMTSLLLLSPVCNTASVFATINEQEGNKTVNSTQVNSDTQTIESSDELLTNNESDTENTSSEQMTEYSDERVESAENVTSIVEDVEENISKTESSLSEQISDVQEIVEQKENETIKKAVTRNRTVEPKVTKLEMDLKDNQIAIIGSDKSNIKTILEQAVFSGAQVTYDNGKTEKLTVKAFEIENAPDNTEQFDKRKVTYRLKKNPDFYQSVTFYVAGDNQLLAKKEIPIFDTDIPEKQPDLKKLLGVEVSSRNVVGEDILDEAKYLKITPPDQNPWDTPIKWEENETKREYSYAIEYQNKKIESKLVVKKDLSSLKVKPVHEMYYKVSEDLKLDNYNPIFLEAKDKDGKGVGPYWATVKVDDPDVKDKRITSEKLKNYQVTYSYLNHEAKSTVKVIPHPNIKLPLKKEGNNSVEINMMDDFNPLSLVDMENSSDENKNRLTFDRLNVEDKVNGEVYGEFNSAIVGDHTVTYSYKGVEVIIKVKVKEVDKNIIVVDTAYSIYEGVAFNSSDFFKEAYDEKGENIDYKEFEFETKYNPEETKVEEGIKEKIPVTITYKKDKNLKLETSFTLLKDQTFFERSTGDGVLPDPDDPNVNRMTYLLGDTVSIKGKVIKPVILKDGTKVRPEDFKNTITVTGQKMTEKNPENIQVYSNALAISKIPTQGNETADVIYTLTNAAGVKKTITLKLTIPEGKAFLNTKVPDGGEVHYRVGDSWSPASDIFESATDLSGESVKYESLEKRYKAGIPPTEIPVGDRPQENSTFNKPMEFTFGLKNKAGNYIEGNDKNFKIKVTQGMRVTTKDLNLVYQDEFKRDVLFQAYDTEGKPMKIGAKNFVVKVNGEEVTTEEELAAKINTKSSESMLYTITFFEKLDGKTIAPIKNLDGSDVKATVKVSIFDLKIDPQDKTIYFLEDESELLDIDKVQKEMLGMAKDRTNEPIDLKEFKMSYAKKNKETGAVEEITKEQIKGIGTYIITYGYEDYDGMKEFPATLQIIKAEPGIIAKSVKREIYVEGNKDSKPWTPSDSFEAATTKENEIIKNFDPESSNFISYQIYDEKGETLLFDSSENSKDLNDIIDQTEPNAYKIQFHIYKGSKEHRSSEKEPLVFVESASLNVSPSSSIDIIKNGATWLPENSFIKGMDRLGNTIDNWDKAKESGVKVYIKTGDKEQDITTSGLKSEYEQTIQVIYKYKTIEKTVTVTFKGKFELVVPDAIKFEPFKLGQFNRDNRPNDISNGVSVIDTKSKDSDWVLKVKIGEFNSSKNSSKLDGFALKYGGNRLDYNESIVVAHANEEHYRDVLRPSDLYDNLRLNGEENTRLPQIDEYKNEFTWILESNSDEKSWSNAYPLKGSGDND